MSASAGSSETHPTCLEVRIRMQLIVPRARTCGEGSVCRDSQGVWNTVSDRGLLLNRPF